jgi:formiminotetrahydrofolate cyclodeaminase
MVCRLTVDHPDYADAAADLRERLAVLAELRQRFVALAEADEAAYGRYIEASALPRVTDEEKCARRRALQAALAGAADVPLAVMTTCLNLATALEPVAREGNRHLLSDVLVAAHLTRAVAAGAAESVRANTTLIRDDDERAPREARRDRLAAEIETAIANLTAAASTRL